MATSGLRVRFRPVIVVLKGGLGNQLFQIAFALNQRITNHRDAILYLGYYSSDYGRRLDSRPILDTIGLPSFSARGFKAILRGSGFPTTLVANESVSDTTIGRKASLIYDGYWQDESFVAGEPLSIIRQAAAEAGLYRSGRRDEIAVHVRRGDYKLPHNQNVFISLTTQYYKDALDAARRRFPDAIVCCYTDDVGWLRSSDGRRFRRQLGLAEVRSGDAVDDFRDMAASRAVIAANSTFSWWAAAIGQPELTIAPSRWYHESRRNPTFDGIMPDVKYSPAMAESRP